MYEYGTKIEFQVAGRWLPGKIVGLPHRDLYHIEDSSGVLHHSVSVVQIRRPEGRATGIERGPGPEDLVTRVGLSGVSPGPETPVERSRRERHIRETAFGALESARLPVPPSYLSNVSHLHSVSESLQRWLRMGGKASDYARLFNDSDDIELREACLESFVGELQSGSYTARLER